MEIEIKEEIKQELPESKMEIEIKEEIKQELPESKMEIEIKKEIKQELPEAPDMQTPEIKIEKTPVEDNEEVPISQIQATAR